MSPSSFARAVSTGIFCQLHASDTRGKPIAVRNSLSISAAFGALRRRLRSFRSCSRRRRRTSRHPSSANCHTVSSFGVAFNSCAMRCRSSFESPSGPAWATITSKASAAMSSQYASQNAVRRTIADLFRTSRPTRRPRDGPPSLVCSSRSRSISRALLSNAFRALLATVFGA